ncbi:MAG: hypothetical protein JWO04_5420 [Gammaproteobacteria bacterium]|nr:hypothetical protein [Gammaproteobacteria bacterium]
MNDPDVSQQIDANLHDLPALLEVIYVATRGDGRGQKQQIYKELASRHGNEWSLLQAIRTAVADEKMRQKAYLCLMPAVAHLQISPTEICELTAFLRKQDPKHLWSLREPVTALFRSTASLGQQCIDYAVAHPDELSFDDVAILLNAFATASPEAALRYFHSIVGSGSERARTAALRGITVIADTLGASVLVPYAKDLRASTESAINTEGTAFSAWLVLCRLSEIDPALRPMIERAAESGPKQAQAAICGWLPRLPAEVWPEESFVRIAQRLLIAALNDDAIRPEVDGAIGRLIDVPATRSFVLQVCDALCEPGRQIELKEVFPNIFGAFTAESALFSQVASRWLLKPKVATIPLRSLLQHTFLDPESLTPDVGVFVEAESSTRVKAVRRVLGVSLSGPAICHFMFVFATASDLQPWGLEAFREVFTNYLFVEFPNAAREFLSGKSTTVDANSPIGAAITELLGALTEWDGVLRSLPEAKELRPSEAKLWALRRVWAHEQREIHKQAERQSVFAQFVTKFNVKQGRKVVTRIPGQPPQLMELKQMSHSFELPGSERSDPIWGQRQRLLYLRDES